jgi:hypothetical protein
MHKYRHRANYCESLGECRLGPFAAEESIVTDARRDIINSDTTTTFDRHERKAR